MTDLLAAPAVPTDPTDPAAVISAPATDRLIYSLIPQVMAQVGAVEKTRRTESGGSFAYRGIDDIYDQLQPVLAELGVFAVPKLESVERREVPREKGAPMTSLIVRVRYRICARDGSYVELITIGEATDAGDRAAAKAQTAAIKTAWISLLSLATHDPDSGGDAARQPGGQGGWQERRQRFEPADAGRADSSRRSGPVGAAPASPPAATPAPTTGNGAGAQRAVGEVRRLVERLLGQLNMQGGQDAFVTWATEQIAKAGEDVARLAEIEKLANTRLATARARPAGGRDAGSEG